MLTSNAHKTPQQLYHTVDQAGITRHQNKVGYLYDRFSHDNPKRLPEFPYTNGLYMFKKKPQEYPSPNVWGVSFSRAPKPDGLQFRPTGFDMDNTSSQKIAERQILRAPTVRPQFHA